MIVCDGEVSQLLKSVSLSTISMILLESAKWSCVPFLQARYPRSNMLLTALRKVSMEQLSTAEEGSHQLAHTQTSVLSFKFSTEKGAQHWLAQN